MDLVRGPDAPEEKRGGDHDEADGEGPEALLRLHDAVVAPRELDGQPVADAAGEDGTGGWLLLVDWIGATVGVVPGWTLR